MLPYLLDISIGWDMVGLALAIAASITGLSYMLGEFFNMPSVKSFAKVEFTELFVTAIVIAMSLALVSSGLGAFDKISAGFMLPDGHPDRGFCDEWDRSGDIAFGQAHYFLGCSPKLIIGTSGFPWVNIEVKGIMLGKLTKAYTSMMGTEMFIGFLSGTHTNAKIPMRLAYLNVGVAPWVSMGPLSDIHTILVDTVGATWAAFAAQKVVLVFIEESMLQIFLPFGCLLRAFPFTRRTGSTIVAVAFAAYFIYPTSILVNQQIYEQIIRPAPEPGAVCAANGAACAADLDCCSRDCRARVCASPLTDFTSYQSIYGICTTRPDIRQEEIDDILEQRAIDQERNITDLNYLWGGSANKYTKTESRLNDAWFELDRRFDATVGLTTSMLVHPLPGDSTTAIMRQLEIAVIDAMQFTILGILFIVVEVVITMTLMKDFAMLIGGESKILGMSKLV